MVLFTIVVVTLCKVMKPIDYVFDYPQPIIDRCYDLGLIPSNKKVLGPKVYIKKGIAGILLGVLLGCVVRFINHADTFLSGFLIAYALWLIVDWYDVLIDIFWFCRDEYFVIPGTEDLTDSYHDYGYHVRASARGMLLGLIAAIIAGIIVII